MNHYLVVFKREFRDEELPDWHHLPSGVPGLNIRMPGTGRRVRVEATPEAISELRKRLAGSCHIEPIIEHHLS